MPKNSLIRVLASRTAVVASLTLSVAVHADDYSTAVLADGPAAYYRLGETPSPLPAARNSGSLGISGNGSHVNAMHGNAGVIAGSANGSTYYDGSGARTTVPWNATLNPSGAFTIEAWIKPTIEGSGNAQAPVWNRHSPSPRGGWTFFQRNSGEGWNFRMYKGSGSDFNEITGGPYTVGAWSHVVATYDGTTARLYVNGAEVGSVTIDAYQANTDNPLSVGAYGGDNPGDNPFTGFVDELAVYTSALSPTQIQAHYDNALNASRTVAYEALIAADGAVEYLRLNEPSAINSGSIGAAADGTHTTGVKLDVAGAIAGSPDTAASYMGIQDADGGSPTTIPYNAALNPSGSFSVEAWIKPTVDGFGNRQCPMHNRASTAPNGGGDRTGWDLFQNTSTGGYQWRLFNGSGSARVFDPQGGTYTVGQWQHMVLVYNAAVPSASIYLDGVLVAVDNTPTGTYAAKTNGDLAIGSYSNPALNDLGYENAFTGSMDEVAIYSTALTGAQILSHYQNGTNAARATPYPTLIAAANPVGYWRLNESRSSSVQNSGTLGTAAAGVDADAFSVAGPQSPAYAGFDAANKARNFDGSSSYVELGNPAGLNFTGPITLEAWVKPAANQDSFADILAHGVNREDNAEVMMRLTDANTYAVSSWDGVTHGTGAGIPFGDLGGTDWIHLVGTYNGVDWNLYRNGILIGSGTDATGSILVNNANWALGARGRWTSAFGITSGAAFPDRTYEGAIDEAAIYNYALSPSQVQRHYSAGKYGVQPLTIMPSGTDVILTWPAGTLQEADDVSGTYNDVPAGSPLVIPASAAKKFYRVRFE